MVGLATRTGVGAVRDAGERSVQPGTSGALLDRSSPIPRGICPTSDFWPRHEPRAIYRSFHPGRGASSHATLGAVFNLASPASAESAPNVITSPMLNR